MSRHSWNVRCSDPLPLCLLWQDAQTHARKAHMHTPAITSIPSAPNQNVADPVALLMRFSRMDVFVCENVPIRMSQRRGRGQKGGQGTEGVIKLKRLGEDELLRIYESRHWLHKANPAHSAFKGALGGKGTRRTHWSGGEALCLDWYKPVQTDISMFRSFGWQRKGCWICFPNAQEQGQRSCQTVESRRKRYDRLRVNWWSFLSSLQSKFQTLVLHVCSRLGPGAPLISWFDHTA